MSYSCYLGGVEWPTPAKLTVKIKGKIRHSRCSMRVKSISSAPLG